MLYRNILGTILVLITAFVKPVETKKWLISESSSLSVNGTTNINKFACDIPAYDQTDTLTLTRGSKEIMLSGDIRLKVQSFDCHNSIMTHDLRKTLREKEFPRLHIRFLSLSDFPELTAKPAIITGLVDIELAGATKRFQVNYQVSIDAQKNIHLLGSRDVNFSDFNLIPPRKLGGMIKTNDKLSVAFHLKMRAVN
ncbi:YceI family protein [Mucilaginibacter sp. UYCu711]|uniref:YceI family protein n=1 Tax=Mucilaginibacter sp. UYCu711 TaxID=3156339 RepID=UPI003D1B8E47